MTTMTNPHELLTTVPYLMGSHPEDSIVFVAIKDGQASFAMRMDYPRGLLTEKITLLIDHLQREIAEEVVIVFYKPDDVEQCDDFVSITQRLLSEARIPISEFIIVSKRRWRSVLCTDLDCCPPKGTLLTPKPKRELLARIGTIEEIDYSIPDFQKLQQCGALAVNDLLVEYREKGSGTSLNLIALVLVRLLDLQVRDYALGVANDSIQSEMLPMWRWITSIAPKGYIAPPATLFAELSYENGDGATAMRLIEKALADDPEYQLAKLLRRTFAAGWLPENFRAMRAELHPKICESLFGAQLRAAEALSDDS